MQITAKNEYESHIKRVIISEEEIKKAVKKAGKMLSEKYEGKPLLLVSILKGAFVFLADLSKALWRQKATLSLQNHRGRCR